MKRLIHEFRDSIVFSLSADSLVHRFGDETVCSRSLITSESVSVVKYFSGSQKHIFSLLSISLIFLHN